MGEGIALVTLESVANPELGIFVGVLSMALFFFWNLKSKRATYAILGFVSKENMTAVWICFGVGMLSLLRVAFDIYLLPC